MQRVVFFLWNVYWQIGQDCSTYGVASEELIYSSSLLPGCCSLIAMDAAATAEGSRFPFLPLQCGAWQCDMQPGELARGSGPMCQYCWGNMCAWHGSVHHSLGRHPHTAWCILQGKRESSVCILVQGWGGLCAVQCKDVGVVHVACRGTWTTWAWPHGCSCNSCSLHMLIEQHWFRTWTHKKFMGIISLYTSIKEQRNDECYCNLLKSHDPRKIKK